MQGAASQLAAWLLCAVCVGHRTALLLLRVVCGQRAAVLLLRCGCHGG